MTGHTFTVPNRRGRAQAKPHGGHSLTFKSPRVGMRTKDRTDAGWDNVHARGGKRREQARVGPVRETGAQEGLAEPSGSYAFSTETNGLSGVEV